jgi:hypothetical protein
MNLVLYRYFCWDSAVVNTSSCNLSIFANNPHALSMLPKKMLRHGTNSLFFINGYYHPQVVPTVRLPLSISNALAEDIEVLHTPRVRKARFALEVAETCGESLHYLQKPSQLKLALQKRQGNLLKKRSCPFNH